MSESNGEEMDHDMEIAAERVTLGLCTVEARATAM